MRRWVMTVLGAAAILAVAGCGSSIAGTAVGATSDTSPATTSASGNDSPTSTPSPASTTDTPGTTSGSPSAATTPSSPAPRTSPTATSGPPTTAQHNPSPKLPAAFTGAQSVDPKTFRGTVTPIGFTSPSGNISCGFPDGGGAVCQIQHFTYRPPAGDCHGGGLWGNAIQLTVSTAPRFFCAGDVESGGPVLAYGSSITVGELACVSRKDGVTCADSSGHSFRVATASYEFTPGGRGTTPPTASATSETAALRLLAGDWEGHGRHLSITPAGAGTLDYRTYQWCSDDPTPPCDAVSGNEIHDGGHLTFSLHAAQRQDAGVIGAGTITASSDPKYRAGSPIGVAASGYNLGLSVWPDTPFCRPDTPEGNWNCGA